MRVRGRPGAGGPGGREADGMAGAATDAESGSPVHIAVHAERRMWATLSSMGVGKVGGAFMPERAVCGICGRALGTLERRLSYGRDGARMCRACCDRICAEAGVASRIKASTAGKTAVKLLFGILFVATCPGQSSIGAGITAIVIGAALIAWALVPAWWYRTNCDAVVACELGRKTASASETRRCGACGGVSSGGTCDYCGSPLDNSRHAK